MAITSHGPGMRTTGNVPPRRCSSICWAIARRRRFSPGCPWPATPSGNAGTPGNFFNILWALPGVSRCGPLATGAYLKEQSWYYDLARGWEGGFGYQGSPAGEEEHNKYTNWDCTGAYLLAYALPLKSLYLTGKKPCSVPPLNASGGGGGHCRGTRLHLRDRQEWLPTTGARPSSCWPACRVGRRRCASVRPRRLGQREGDFVPTLLKLLAGSDRDARYGACEALGCLGPRADAAAPQLRALLKDPDPWLQSLACKALPALGPEARKASVSDLLAMTARANPADPRRMAQRAACIALFSPYPGSRTPPEHPGRIPGGR